MTTTEQSYAVTPQLAETIKKYQHHRGVRRTHWSRGADRGIFPGGPQQFLRSYLVGFWFWFGMGMGRLVLLMTHFVSGGAWGMMIRRPLEAGTQHALRDVAAVPAAADLCAEALFVGRPGARQADKIVQAKHLYLNVPFLWIRWVIYGVVWLGLTYLLNKWSLLEDETKSTKYSSKLEKLSAPGIVAYFFTITFASVDFLMSLDAALGFDDLWISDCGGAGLIGDGVDGRDARDSLGNIAPMDHAITKKHLHDLGKLMLALVMLWAYLTSRSI